MTFNIVYTRKTNAFLLPLLAHIPAITPQVPSIPNSISICFQSNWRGIPFCIYAVEYIGPETGEMLSDTWDQLRQDPFRRQNLFRSMARIILSLARVPQPRIGSFKFHNNGIITLTNRPLPCSMIILENDGAPRTISRNETYTCTEPFVADMLTFHDNFFLSNPRAVSSMGDCLGQMASQTLLRTISHHYIQRETRNGPFRLQLTDIPCGSPFRW